MLGGEIPREASALGLSSHVTFHGFLPEDALRTFYRRADLLVHSSRHEAGPLVALEAAACGVPTVGTAVGHIRDFARSAPGRALAVPVGDDAALAAGILALLADEPRRRAMGEAARDLGACARCGRDGALPSNGSTRSRRRPRRALRRREESLEVGSGLSNRGGLPRGRRETRAGAEAGGSTDARRKAARRSAGRQ